MPADSRSVRRRANLARILAPRHIVFLGGDHACQAIKVCRKAGYAGEIFAVHPKRNEMEGIPCLPRLADLPVAPDAGFLSIPAGATIEAVADLARLGAGGAVCYASGFAELGTAEGRAREKALIEAAGDLAIVGPNCFGVINYVTHASLWSVAYPVGVAARGVAVIGQSGNACINISMSQRQVPFSYIVSAGNQSLLGFEDYIEVLSADAKVTAIGLFLEGLRDVPAFSRACIAAAERGIPLVAFRVGVSEVGAKLAASHTGSLAGDNALYEALFERLGVMQARSLPEFLELLKTASVSPKPKGRRLAAFGTSGGDCGMTADFASAAGLSLPQPSEAAREAIKALLPDYAQVANPLDFTAGNWGQEEVLTKIFSILLRDGTYDQGLLVIDHPRLDLGEESRSDITAMVRAMGKAGRDSGVPGAVASVNPESMPEVMRVEVLAEGLIPLQGLPEATASLGRWAAHAERSLGPAPAAVPDLAPIEKENRRFVDENESKLRLGKFGLALPGGMAVAADEVGGAAARLGSRVAIKALSSHLPHKTEAGAVALGIAGAKEAEAVVARIRQNIAQRHPGLTIDRFLVEPMIEDGIGELLVGVKRDPRFGLVLLLAAGGVLVEILGDSRCLLLPTSGGEVEAALRRLKLFPLFDGFRGRPKADLGAAVEAVLAVAAYAEANAANLLELDVNPLILRPEGKGAVAVDALIVEAA